MLDIPRTRLWSWSSWWLTIYDVQPSMRPSSPSTQARNSWKVRSFLYKDRFRRTLTVSQHLSSLGNGLRDTAISISMTNCMLKMFHVLQLILQGATRAIDDVTDPIVLRNWSITKLAASDAMSRGRHRSITPHRTRPRRMESIFTFTSDLNVPFALLHPARLTKFAMWRFAVFGRHWSRLSSLPETQNLWRWVGWLNTAGKPGVFLFGEFRVAIKTQDVRNSDGSTDEELVGSGPSEVSLPFSCWDTDGS